jgi:hypothetical protein
LWRKAEKGGESLMARLLPKGINMSDVVRARETATTPPDPTRIYDIQIQVATDTGVSNQNFEICVLEIKPMLNGGSSK